MASMRSMLASSSSTGEISFAPIMRRNSTALRLTSSSVWDMGFRGCEEDSVEGFARAIAQPDHRHERDRAGRCDIPCRREHIAGAGNEPACDERREPAEERGAYHIGQCDAR